MSFCRIYRGSNDQFGLKTFLLLSAQKKSRATCRMGFVSRLFVFFRLLKQCKPRGLRNSNKLLFTKFFVLLKNLFRLA